MSSLIKPYLTVAVIILIAAIAAGCSGRTLSAVAGKNSATLTAEGSCEIKCTFYARYKKAGNNLWSATPRQTVGKIGTTKFNLKVSGLASGTSYDWQICGNENGSSFGCVGPDGTSGSMGRFKTASSGSPIG